MIGKYRSASKLGKAFAWLTLGIFITALALYAKEVTEALAMDPNSYNCVHDSMMKQICRDPWGSSVAWAILQMVFLGWPVLLAWVVIGIVLAWRRRQTRPH